MQAPQARAPIICLSLPARLAELLQTRDHRALSGTPALRGELGEVQLGFVSVREPDNYRGMPAYGFQVGVEGGQEQVV
jgi:hypothetical protein